VHATAAEVAAFAVPTFIATAEVFTEVLLLVATLSPTAELSNMVRPAIPDAMHIQVR